MLGMAGRVYLPGPCEQTWPAKALFVGMVQLIELDIQRTHHQWDAQLTAAAHKSDDMKKALVLQLINKRRGRHTQEAATTAQLKAPATSLDDSDIEDGEYEDSDATAIVDKQAEEARQAFEQASDAHAVNIDLVPAFLRVPIPSDHRTEFAGAAFSRLEPSCCVGSMGQ